MKTLTALPYDKQYIEQFSSANDEPTWMKQFRLDAFEQVESLDMPKPDKTNINRWNFTTFNLDAEGETINSLDELPEALEDFIDKENKPENIVILRNQSVAYSKV